MRLRLFRRISAPGHADCLNPSYCERFLNPASTPVLPTFCTSARTPTMFCMDGRNRTQVCPPALHILSTHSTLYTWDFARTLYMLHPHFTLTLSTLELTLCTPHSALLHFYTCHPTLYTLDLSLHTLDLSLHSQQFTFNTLDFTLHTLHFNFPFDTSCSTLYTFRFTLALHTWPSAFYIHALHATLHIWHPQFPLHTLHVTFQSQHILHTAFHPFRCSTIWRYKAVE